jgi:hypothetical protein
MKIKIEKKQGLLIILLICMIFLPRFLNLSRFLNVDGCNWFTRSIKFYAGLAHVEDYGLKDTLQSRHPGVTLMILSGAYIIVGVLIKYGDLNVLGHKSELLFSAKAPIAIVTGLGIIFLYFLLTRRFKKSLFPITAAIFIAIDPFFLAHSRYFQLDSLTATFMLLALITFLFHGQTVKTHFLILSAIFTALAILTKSYALALIPFIAVGMVFQNYSNYGNLGPFKLFKEFTAWMLIAGLTFIIIWPSMWIQPVHTIKGLFNNAVFHIEHTHENTGSLRQNIPGKLHSPMKRNLAFRSVLLKGFVQKNSSIILLLGIISLCVMIQKMIRRKMDQETEIIAYLSAFFIFFLIGMSFTGKASIRYCVICFILFDIIAAYGFVHLWSWFKRADIYNRWGRLASALLIVFLSLHIFRVFSYHPYYQSFQNEFYQEELVCGWGEGLEKVGEYLNNKSNAEQLTVASFYPCVLDQFSKSKVVNLKSIKENTPDYVVLYGSQVARYLYPELVRKYYLNQKPEFVARIKNMEYAWLYPNIDNVRSTAMSPMMGLKIH